MRGNHSSMAMLGLRDRGDDYGSAKTVRWPDVTMKPLAQWNLPYGIDWLEMRFVRSVAVSLN